MTSPGWVDGREEALLFLVVILFGFIGVIVELTNDEEEHEERMALYDGVKEIVSPDGDRSAGESRRSGAPVRNRKKARKP